MKRTKTFVVLACVLLTLGLAGCGAFKGSTNDLSSITLNVTLINGVAPTSQSGFVTLQGNGGTIQLQAMGNYSGGTSKDITNKVTFSAEVDPAAHKDAFGTALIPPCQAGACPSPGTPPYTAGTVEYSPTGLITAVEPAVCTFVDTAPLDPVTGKPTTPSWAYTGDYVVTATYLGITSQPIYIPVASAVGNPFYGGQENNPDAFCDSGTY